jgi:hypothetical protein
MSDPVEKEDIQPSREACAKLEAIRKATELSFPIGDIEEILIEIERGYQGSEIFVG